MGVDLSKQKERKNEEVRKAGERAARNAIRNVKRWKPRQGDNKIRLLPPWAQEGINANNFCSEVYLHWNLPGVEYPVLCVAQTIGHGGVCAVCELVAKLRTSEDPQDQEMAKELRAKPSYDSNIVDLKYPIYTDADAAAWEEENAGQECPFEVGQTKVQVYTYGTGIFKDLLDYFADGVDITDLATGFDVKITRDGKGREGTKYRVRIETVSTPLVVQGGINIMEKLVNLDLLHQAKTDVEVRALLAGDTAPAAKQLPGKPSEVSEESEDEEPEVVAPKKVTKKAPAEAGSVDELTEKLKAAVKGK